MNDMVLHVAAIGDVAIASAAHPLGFHPIANVFPLIEGGEFGELVSDIRTEGLRQPIVLYDGMILDGRNRYRACLEIGIEPTFTKYDGADPVKFVISLNLRRRHLDESQRSLVAARLENLGHGQRADLRDANWHLFNDPPIPPITRSAASGLLNVGERSVARASSVLDAGAPELIHKVETGKVSVSAAADIATLPKTEQREIIARGEKEILEKSKEIRAARADNTRTARIVKLAEISNNSRACALGDMGRFPVLYADPPWRYDAIATVSREIENHYPTMSAEELLALRVCDVSTDDAILYVWATAPKLTECCALIEAWGFTYRTNLVWVKDKIGMGYHARSQHELLLVAKRGNIPPPAPSDRVSSVIYAERGDHSSKPESFYELIESFYPALPKLELFARSQRDGWSSWGNQATT